MLLAAAPSDELFPSPKEESKLPQPSHKMAPTNLIETKTASLQFSLKFATQKLLFVKRLNWLSLDKAFFQNQILCSNILVFQ
jgi:hypothetical protein